MSAETSPKHYVKIWAILVVLLILSVLGPMLGIKLVTLLTAFGIAIVKATMVANHFMHLNIEKKYISYLLIGMVLMVFLFVGGTSPDVLMPEGQHWEKQVIEQPVELDHGGHE
ncbi:MAG: caa(3)-type oxidase subunit IV [Bdellovibrio sp.]|nr:MAG: caa(3)-type oxidase subunit IV [Bdellovibrio sp.]